MNILIMTIPVSITLAILFLLFFLSAAKNEQFDNLDTSSQIPFSDDEPEPTNSETKETTHKKSKIGESE